MVLVASVAFKTSFPVLRSGPDVIHAQTGAQRLWTNHRSISILVFETLRSQNFCVRVFDMCSRKHNWFIVHQSLWYHGLQWIATTEHP